MSVTPHHGDCLQVMEQMARDGVKVDAIGPHQAPMREAA